MKLIGITLKRPSFDEITAASAMAVGLWVSALGLMHTVNAAVDRYDAGALLLIALWGCLSARLGIRVGMGHRHLVANLMVSAGLLTAYNAVTLMIG